MMAGETRKYIASWIAFWCALTTAMLVGQLRTTQTQKTTADFFEKRIRPILSERC